MFRSGSATVKFVIKFFAKLDVRKYDTLDKIINGAISNGVDKAEPCNSLNSAVAPPPPLHALCLSASLPFYHRQAVTGLLRFSKEGRKI